MDLSGFTYMTEDLMDQGTEGAEMLSDVINKLFDTPIHRVYARGGHIATFAGDAFTAVFPGRPAAVAAQAAAAAAEIAEYLEQHRRVETPYGRYRIAARIGVGAGTVEWGVTEAGRRNAYYVRGDAIRRAVGVLEEADTREILLDPDTVEAATTAGAPLSTRGHGNFFLLDDLDAGGIDPPQDAEEPAEVNAEAMQAFFPPSVVGYSGRGEFRRVTAVFVSLSDVEDADRLDEAVTEILELSEEFGGYFNLLDYGDKGHVALLVFGAPTAHEQDLQRGVDFASALTRRLSGGSGAGVAEGIVYAGLVGSARRATYTVLGATANLAARLMQRAEDGDVLVAGSTAERIERQYELTSHGRREIKGFDEPVEIYRVGAPTHNEERPFHGPFVGREEPFTYVKEMVAAVAAGRPSGIASIYGEAGLGKSRLVHEVLETAPENVRVIHLEVDPVLKKSFNPFVRFLTLRFALPRGEEARRAAFEQGFEEFTSALAAVENEAYGDEPATSAAMLTRNRSILGAVLGIRWEDSLYEQLDPRARFDNTVYVLAELIRAHAFLSPVVCVVDGVHALDADSPQPLQYLNRIVGDLPFAMITTARPDEEQDLLPQLENPHGTTSFALAPFSREETATLLEKRLGGTPQDSLVETISEKTGGNPFYFDQMISYLTENHLLRHDADGFVLGTEIEDVPTDLTGVLLARLDRLSAELREVTQAASVVGSRFPIPVVRLLLRSLESEITARDGELEDLLDRGARQRLWYRREDGEYEFHSSLLRDAAYQMQSRDRVKRLHTVAAYVGEQRFAGDDTRSADLAYHFSRADVFGKTRDYLRRAAEFAAGNFKNDKAVEFYTQLLDLADPHEQIDICYQLGEILDIRGDWDEALEHLEHGLEVSKELFLHRKRARVLTKIGEIYQKRSSYDAAVDTLKRAGALARKIKAPDTEREALLFLGRTYWSMGEFDKGIVSLTHAGNNPQGAGEERTGALAVYYLGVIHRDKAEYDEAMRRFRESQERFEKLGEKRLESFPLYDMAVLHLYRGNTDTARDYFTQIEKLYRDIGYQSGLAAALGNLGVLAARSGDFEAAFGSGSEALEIAEHIGERLAVAYGKINLGIYHYMQSSHRDALAWLAAAREIIEDIGARGYLGFVLPYTACAHALLGEYENALRTARDNLLEIKRTGSDVENGRTALAVAMALAHAERTATPISDTARALLSEIGDLVGTDGSPDSLFRRAVETAEHAGYVQTWAPALTAYGEYLVDRALTESGSTAGDAEGRAARAREVLAEARERSEAAGMVSELSRVEEAARRLEQADRGQQDLDEEEP
jgi:class 3 adenylate cyclase/tetratricopeptide (TPR) repeat protein